MKTISLKQFENAVKKVQNGGKSLLVTTSEVKPFSWAKSGKYFNLKNTLSVEAWKYAKFLRNDSSRLGKEHEVYLIYGLSEGYEIALTKKEQEKERKELLKKEIQRKRETLDRREKIKAIAKKHGFKSVAELNRHNKAIELYNDQMEIEIGKKAIEIFEKEGVKYLGLISHRVKLERIKDIIRENFPQKKQYFK